MTMPFGASTIKTGVTASTDTTIPDSAMQASHELEVSSGYFTPNAGYIEVAGKKVLGRPCAQGYYYAGDSEEEVVVMEDLVKRGYAYAAVSGS